MIIVNYNEIEIVCKMCVHKLHYPRAYKAKKQPTTCLTSRVILLTDSKLKKYLDKTNFKQNIWKTTILYFSEAYNIISCNTKIQSYFFVQVLDDFFKNLIKKLRDIWFLMFLESLNQNLIFNLNLNKKIEKFMVFSKI